MSVVTLAAQRRRETAIPKWVWWIGLFVVAAVLYALFAGTTVQPHSDQTPLFQAFNDLRDWIRDNRDNLIFVIFFGVPRVAIDGLVEGLTGFLQAIGWPALVAIGGVLGFIAGGWRLAGLVAVGFLSLGVLGLWESSIETLGAILAAVAISYAIGVPLGVLAARNERFRRLITPILDVMQIMPTFAYLAPFVLFFGIGPAAAAIVTLIYAMPAAIRITALGIRRVPTNAVEAGESLGATRWQLLGKVRLPLARRELGLALNQTIMLALSMIVITALIDAPGLGQDVIRALIRTDVGAMFDAGLAIVILAIILDRLTEQASERLDPRHRGRRMPTLPRRVLLVCIGVLVALAVAGLVFAVGEEFPEDVALSFREPINAFVDWLRSDVRWLTVGLKDAFAFNVLNPLQAVFTQAPFWLVIGLVAGMALLASGPRQAIVAAGCLAVVYAMGLWQHSMETLLQVLVATAIVVGLALVLGIAIARSDRLNRMVRPFLDAAQVMPAFVYLIPAFVLFEAGRVTAIFAAVVFALPPVTRLVDVGIRAVPPAIVEAATSSGASGWQILTKVQLPVARPALQLAVNQAVIIVLSTVVIGGLVGGQALGYDVVAGFSQNQLFGLGLAAGIALVLLGVMLDRMTQGAGGRARATVR